MFVSNSPTSFRLWLKKNLVKHKKVSKYCENECRNIVQMTSEKSFVLPMYFISLMDVAQNLILLLHILFILSYKRFLFLKLMAVIESSIPLKNHVS